MAIFLGFRKALKRTASLLPLMPKTRPLYRGNHAITILRIFLWVMPALFLPLVALLGGVLRGYLPAETNIVLMLLLMVAATAGIGLFEELLTFQQMRELPANPKRELVVSVIAFVLLQIAIAPTVCIAVTFGFGAAAAWGLF